MIAIDHPHRQGGGLCLRRQDCDATNRALGNDEIFTPHFDWPADQGTGAVGLDGRPLVGGNLEQLPSEAETHARSWPGFHTRWVVTDVLHCSAVRSAIRTVLQLELSPVDDARHGELHRHLRTDTEYRRPKLRLFAHIVREVAVWEHDQITVRCLDLGVVEPQRLRRGR